MATSYSYTHAGHHIVCTPKRTADHGYYASFRIYRGTSPAGDLVYEQSYPAAEFGSVDGANRYAREMATYWLDQWPIKGAFTRKRDGRAISYLGTYSVGHGADWNARVYCDGNLMATPGGAFQYDILSNPNIHQAAEHVILASIEDSIGTPR
ncbi:hypothetical protein ASF61_05830 [Duganella sp. Leaf126]|uniref:hypothetical protein n=1 Tax=Duganella sp. Leaf126 TaxID=1736266 RepID=UPI0006FD2DF9|nr:hypothetical protein [Duganella sp. Leaf126]KQQ40293.1 hypothetical protein ASF61_05830 [Duganella sp. Leaf126]